LCRISILFPRYRNDKKISLRTESGTQAESKNGQSAFFDCFNGAVVGASTTADANVGIDDELVFALRNSLYRAVVSARTTLDASIGNFVSHDFPSNMFILCILWNARLF
jgi:hypothetical protein